MDHLGSESHWSSAQKSMLIISLCLGTCESGGSSQHILLSALKKSQPLPNDRILTYNSNRKNKTIILNWLYGSSSPVKFEPNNNNNNRKSWVMMVKILLFKEVICQQKKSDLNQTIYFHWDVNSFKRFCCNLLTDSQTFSFSSETLTSTLSADDL